MFSFQFLGATDSALPCALLLDVAASLKDLIASRDNTVDAAIVTVYFSCNTVAVLCVCSKKIQIYVTVCSFRDRYTVFICLFRNLLICLLLFSFFRISRQSWCFSMEKRPSWTGQTLTLFMALVSWPLYGKMNHIRQIMNTARKGSIQQ